MTTAIATFPIHGALEQTFIPHNELAELLRSVRGSSIVSIESCTEPRLLAKHPVSGQPNPFRNNVVKVSRVNGIIGWQYERSVNRQRTREEMTPDFESLPRKWGFRLPGTPLVEHEGRLYIELKVHQSLGHRYETLDGRELDDADIEPYLPQHSAGRQGVRGEVILRDYALENILSIKMNGKTYIISDTVEVEAAA